FIRARLYMQTPLRSTFVRAPRGAIGAVALCVAMTFLLPPASACAALFRPLLADPRENQFRMKWVHSVEDWRFGTDVTDSLSRGGTQRRTGTTWDVGFGETFRADPWRNFLRHRFWKRYQIGVPAGVFANFDRAGAELTNADYQFGLSDDILFRGDLDSLDDI